jgi:molecular chaperone DnaJ
MCPDCNGSGTQMTNKCNVCHGQGTTVKEQAVDVEIPKGVGNGMQMSMAGFGNHTINGVPGDLYIVFDEIREPYFRREGGNIIVDSEISVIDAIIGANVSVKSPHGDIMVAIEPGTEHGKIIRINGKGIPDAHEGMGSLVINIKIRIPKSINLEQKAILEKLKNAGNF